MSSTRWDQAVPTDYPRRMKRKPKVRQLEPLDEGQMRRKQAIILANKTQLQIANEMRREMGRKSMSHTLVYLVYMGRHGSQSPDLRRAFAKAVGQPMGALGWGEDGKELPAGAALPALVSPA